MDHRGGRSRALRALVLGLLVPTIFAVQATEDVKLEVQELHGKGIFLQEADLIVPDAYADVIVDVPLGKTEDRIKKNKKIADLLFKDDDVLLKATKARIYTLCDQDLQRWRRTRALAMRHQSVQGNRKERFLGILAALTASAATGIGGFIWGRHEDHVALARLAKEQGKIIRVAQQDQMRISALEAHSRLQDSILANEVEQARLREKSFQAVIWLLTAVASQGREVDYLEELVAGVVMEGRANTGLWGPEAFTQLVASIEEEAKAEGLQLAVRDEQELLRAPTSYGIFSSRLLRIVLHCPLHNTHSQFRVLRWANLPSRIAGWTRYGRLRTEAASHRLLTNARRQSFAVRHEDMATWWKPRASLYISVHAPTLSEADTHPDFDASTRDCLQELWQSGQGGQHKRCEWVLADATSMIHLSGHQWAACGNGSVEMQVRIKGELKHAARPDGCLQVTLPPGSELSLGGQTVRTGQSVGPVHRVIPVPPVTLPREMLAALAVRSNGTTRSLDQLRGWHPGAVLHSATELRPVQIQEGFPWWDLSLGAAGFALTGTMMSLCCLLCKQWRRWCGTRRGASRAGQPTTDSSGDDQGDERKSDPANALSSGKPSGTRHLGQLTKTGESLRVRRSSLPDQSWEQARFLLERLQSQGNFGTTLTLSPQTTPQTTNPSAPLEWTPQSDPRSSRTSSQLPRQNWTSDDSWDGGSRRTTTTLSSRTRTGSEAAGIVDVYIA